METGGVRMWLEELLAEVSDQVMEEVELQLPAFTEDAQEVAGIPEDLRRLVAARFVLGMQLRIAQLDMRDKEFEQLIKDQIVAIQMLLTVSLRHVGIDADLFAGDYRLARGWKIVRLPERKVILADQRMTQAVAAFTPLVAPLTASPAARRSTIRL